MMRDATRARQHEYSLKNIVSTTNAPHQNEEGFCSQDAIHGRQRVCVCCNAVLAARFFPLLRSLLFDGQSHFFHDCSPEELSRIWPERALAPNPPKTGHSCAHVTNQCCMEATAHPANCSLGHSTNLLLVAKSHVATPESILDKCVSKEMCDYLELAEDEEHCVKKKGHINLVHCLSCGKSSPNWPCWLSPHVQTVPSPFRSALWCHPTLI